MLTIRMLTALGLAAVAIAPALADNTDNKNVTVGGTIVAPLEITVAQNMIMPHIARPSTGEPASRVTMTCGATGDASNIVAYTNRGNPFANGVSTAANPSLASANRGLGVANATGTCAVLNVAGEANYYFLVTLGAVSNPGAPNVNVGNPSCKDEFDNVLGNSSQGQLTAAGTLSVKCGASALVNSLAGTSYTASFDFTVTYD